MSVNIHVCKEDYVWNPNTCACKNDEYLKKYAYMKNICNDSVIICDQVIDRQDAVLIDFIEKKKEM